MKGHPTSNPKGFDEIILETVLSNESTGVWARKTDKGIQVGLSTRELLELTEEDAILLAHVLLESVKKLKKKRKNSGT